MFAPAVRGIFIAQSACLKVCEFRGLGGGRGLMGGTAHTGPEAGMEEKRHKWTKYIRPKKILQQAA